MVKFWNHTLTGKMLRLLLAGFCVAAIVFVILYSIGKILLDNYFFDSGYIFRAEESYVRDLQDYVNQYRLAATDVSRLGEWGHKKGIEHFTISRERVLIYDSSYSDTVISGQTQTEFLHYNWQYFHQVSFTDGDADVFIYANYETKYYYLFYIFSIIICMALWMILFSLGIRREVSYIRQLYICVSQIESGALKTDVPVKGEDELGMLAQCLDKMRLALLKKEEDEKEMKAAQDKLVLGMAHDLRTPLTGLMTFLEIAKKQHTLEECCTYIEKASVKTAQIRSLSDQLFEFFLIHTEQAMHLEQPEDVEYVLGEYLSELCGLLEADGFQVSIDHLFWRPVRIQICTDYAGRIINNLVSNIKKYADHSAPVELSTEYHDTFCRITLRNKMINAGLIESSTGIGVKNIQSMMVQMNGKCHVRSDSDYYSITLGFPIV